ncbi:ERD (early-responsive to dehydration stress) family protein [Rhynchospora pubera]|uniref:ERD (Early-responsive to dehydration stress) family protein n=1 Tax=Rhynchospora pubera TaxID=906938 RepID=A0AAV8GBB7_9POAL|nr:ERD (early-responsive to dehydration stress) family protein [Rhynchospora pubera]
MSETAFTAPPPDSGEDPLAWYGSIQYLLNISAIGAISCLLLFLLVKLRFDHRRFPGPSALLTKLLSVYHATSSQIALHCGADAAQFLLFERSAFLVLVLASVTALVAALPLNLLAGSNPVFDQFTATTISHIPKGSPLLWVHLLLAGVIAATAHFGISKLEDDLRVTRFRDGQGNPSDPNSGSIAIFTIMIQGIPKSLASDKAPLEEYFQHRYPGKVYRVIVPFDLCSLEYLTTEWTKVTNQISPLEAQMNVHNMFNEFNEGSTMQREHEIWKKAKELWGLLAEKIGLSDEDRLRRLHTKKLVLGSRLMDYRHGRAPGAGIAFVVFKDVYAANKAVRDFRTERRKERPAGQLFPVMELQLGRSGWKVERAPPASDIYWNHLGLNKISLVLRRVAVNTCLILMLLFFSSPLAIISGMQYAARIIDAEAMDQAKSWLDWLETSSWFWTILIQFLPNVLIFISMYIIIPSFLSYFSKFECHLTVSGEQRAALLKMVCFFLVNLILLRALVESSLESALVRMGQCYLDGKDCKRIEEYLSPSFLSRSSLSSLAFLITCTFLGISFDLLAPIPWIKNIFKKFKKNDMVQLVPEENEDYPLEQSSDEGNSLRTPLVQPDSPNGLEGSALDLAVYPTNRSFHMPKQNFDFAQYYAFDLTIFALTMIYSLFAPLVVPVGAVYFGYRYLVDKYNFLFVYRIRGFPAGNDGKLMDRVLCVMQFCVVCFLSSMLLYFSVQGDPTKLEAICTLGLLLFYKLLPSRSDQFRASLLEGMQSVDSFVDGPTDYEVFSNPTFDWDLYQS